MTLLWIIAWFIKVRKMVQAEEDREDKAWAILLITMLGRLTRFHSMVLHQVTQRWALNKTWWLHHSTCQNLSRRNQAEEVVEARCHRKLPKALTWVPWWMGEARSRRTISFKQSLWFQIPIISNNKICRAWTMPKVEAWHSWKNRRHQSVEMVMPAEVDKPEAVIETIEQFHMHLTAIVIRIIIMGMTQTKQMEIWSTFQGRILMVIRYFSTKANQLTS